MKKRLLVFLTAAVSLPVMLVAGCGAVQKADKETGVQEMQVQSALPTEEIKCDLIPAVKVAGKVYYDTGRESDIRARCGVMDGRITGEVDRWKRPEKNGESNFGTGYEYQFADDNFLDLFINGKWFRFEQRSGQ